MASVILLTKDVDYCVDYSIIDGEIREFSESKGDDESRPVTENYEAKLIEVAKAIIRRQSKHKEHGYSAFIYRLVREGKVTLPN